MHPGGPAGAVGSTPMSQEATAAAAANAAAAAAAAVLQRGGAQASVETMEQVPCPLCKTPKPHLGFRGCLQYTTYRGADSFAPHSL